MFRLQQDSLRLVAAREKALAEGIGPDSPNYPDILDSHPDFFKFGYEGKFGPAVRKNKPPDSEVKNSFQ